jgi:hypothetical protein
VHEEEEEEVAGGQSCGAGRLSLGSCAWCTGV